MSPILVLGAGSWGTALSIHLARNNNQVWLWSHEPDIIKTLNDKRENTLFLPGFDLDDAIKITGDLAAFFEQYGNKPHDVMLAVPSFVFDEVLERLEPYKSENTRILWVTKGLSEEGGLLHPFVQTRGYRAFGLLSGPSFAKEVAKGNPTSVSLATTDESFAQDLIKRLHHPRFRLYQSDDIIGVQLGGALKNVIAIGASISDGLGFGINTKSMIMTRGLYELSQLGLAMGAKAQTVYGLSGMGDIILTCSDDQSRNRRFGLNLAKGMSIEDAESAVGQVVEGLRNASQAHFLFKQFKVDAPVFEMVYRILYEAQSVTDAFEAFFHAPQVGEF